MELDLLQDLRSLLSIAGIEHLRHSFLNPPDHEIYCFNLVYDEQAERWDADFENDVTGSRESFSKDFSSELKLTLNPLSEKVVSTFENLQFVYRDTPEKVQKLLETTLIGLQEIRNGVLTNSSILRYHKQIVLLLLNLEGELKKRVPRNSTMSTSAKPKSSALRQPKKLSFGFRYKGDKRMEFLLREVYRKCETASGSFIDVSTDEDTFIDVLNSPDLRDCRVEIQLGCETKQAVYILDKLSKYFKNLKPATIGCSGLFRTKEGNVLTANNIYNARKSNEKTPPKEYSAINDVLEPINEFTKRQ